MSDPEREPMPKSLKPMWLFIGFIFGVIVAIGIASAIIDHLVRLA